MANHSPNIDGIKPHQWQPGQSGNPSGKAIGRKNYSTYLREALEEEVQAGDQKITMRELLMKRIVKKAVEEGDARMIEMVMAYIDGKPIQRVAGEDGGPVQIDMFSVVRKQLKKVYGNLPQEKNKKAK